MARVVESVTLLGGSWVDIAWVLCKLTIPLPNYNIIWGMHGPICNWKFPWDFVTKIETISNNDLQ